MVPNRVPARGTPNDKQGLQAGLFQKLSQQRSSVILERKSIMWDVKEHS